MATAYQIGCTRHRISRRPMSRSPSRPRVMNATTRAAIRAPGGKNVPNGSMAQDRAQARTKKLIIG
jgi:hypothetical protein